eukprot:1413017-Pyramimonas_sp.AAC.1
MPWTTVVHNGRAQRPPPAQPLWCRERATPATLYESETDRETTPSAPLAMSRKCHACHALRARNG